MEDISNNLVGATVTTHDLKVHLLKNAILGVVGLLCLYAFIYDSSSGTAVCGVFLLITLAYISERLDVSEVLLIAGRSVLITGCDTGFGHRLAMELAKEGVIVFAGCFNSDGVGAKALKDEYLSNLHILQMDITKVDQLEQTLSYIRKITDGKGLYGLVNNADFNFVGDIELTTMDQFKKVIDINAVGMVHVTKLFLPLLRLQKGRIVNVSSVKGRYATPFTAAYSMSKFAVEAFSDVLRMELSRWGIKVSIIEPSYSSLGACSLEMMSITNDLDSMWSVASDEVKALYGQEYIKRHIETFEEVRKCSSCDISSVTDKMKHALFSSKPRRRYTITGRSGWWDSYKWRVWFSTYLPSCIMDRWFLYGIRSMRPAASLDNN